MRMHTKIGIVTISFNQVKYVETCVSSIVNQLRLGDNYVIVDPGSSDGSRQVIENLIGGDDRVTLLFEPDKGPSDGLNKGFNANTADVVGYINSDDYILPGCLDYVRDYFDKHPAVDVLIGGIRISNSLGEMQLRGRVSENPNLTKFLTAGFLYFQQGTFIRKSAFNKTGGFRVGNFTCWDFELIVDLALHGSKFGIVNEKLAAFRIHGESITGKGENGHAHSLTMDLIRRRVQDQGYKKQGLLFKLYYLLERKINPFRVVMQFK